MLKQELKYSVKNELFCFFLSSSFSIKISREERSELNLSEVLMKRETIMILMKENERLKLLFFLFLFDLFDLLSICELVAVFFVCVVVGVVVLFL